MNKLEQNIDSIFEKWQGGLCPGGQVAVRKDGKLIYNKNFGYANIEHKVTVKNETVFHVASVSKQITVMCVLLLQEDGQLQIDHDVRDYISEHISFEEPVTIRQMMNNVSGIRDQWELLDLSGVRIVDTITQRDALSLIRKQKKLNFQAQSEFLYSNSNFTLLAEIVEKLSGKTLNEFANERIFKPLGMESTCFKDTHWNVIPKRASSYYDDGTGRFVYSVLNYGAYGATSLNTTATDFLKWMENFKTPTICREETLKIMKDNPKLVDGTESSYAGGLFVGDYKGHKYIEHGGADAAYRSAMLRFTDADVDIVLFSNTQNIPMKDAAFAVADVIFGHVNNLPEAEHPKEYVKEFNSKEVEGYYFSTSAASIMTFDIILKEGKPHLKNPYGDAPLMHVSGNHFRITQLDLDLYFGESSLLKTKDKLIPLQKLTPFQPEDCSIYIGRFESGELGTFYDVIEKEGTLFISHSRNGEEILYQVDENKFITKATFTYIVEFIIGENEITGLSFTGNRVRDVRLGKVTR
ncbi:serine hydrolase domain-containing protein [Anaerobacillus isosaccharinicus]|uniref:Beta-lactamase family protein n=1 Tax=Anaerobacillus isosaccharinicus TaxID=1532552 RepID=A0A1S2L537_9BACI|nr:serine hydrolase domain-containing protein [Anaerobacillus isosaccharinicus]MBA5586362.1 beta-lactamase family protein [Anaerobacillus isosaccharinicus]QOY35392.1 beta-lactamase family protein [Anaerobacillus isosaccharinicus]